jgi:hypothetical protein
VAGAWLFDRAAQEVLRRQLWQVAEYCGVQILTLRWSPETGQVGSLTHNQRNDPHVEEKKTA